MTLQEKSYEMIHKYGGVTEKQKIELKNDLIEFAQIVIDASTENLLKAIDERGML